MKRLVFLTPVFLVLFVFLLVFAACTGSAVSGTEVLAFSDLAPGAYLMSLPQEETEGDYKKTEPVSAEFLRFKAETMKLAAAYAHDDTIYFKIIQEEDENIIIDISFPITLSFELNSLIDAIILNHLDNFAFKNTHGCFFVRGMSFWYNEYVFGLALDLRSYGDADGYTAKKYVFNFDLQYNRIISNYELFEKDADYRGAITALVASSANLTGCEKFNFDSENLYLYIRNHDFSKEAESYTTFTIPLENFGDIWRGVAAVKDAEDNNFEADVRTAVPGYIALTFDDGPHPENTVALLDALAERGVRATFFLLGSEIERYPHVVERMHAEGHSIGNHSFSHPEFTRMGAQNIINELNKTSDRIENITGERPSLHRPPYGSFNDQVLTIVEDMGMSAILWSVDPKDWYHRDAFLVRDNIIKSTTDGSIILMHDIHESSVKATIMAVDILIEKGFTFVTVEELYEINGMTLNPGGPFRSVYRDR